jgi:hypothetical protein
MGSHNGRCAGGDRDHPGPVLAGVDPDREKALQSVRNAIECAIEHLDAVDATCLSKRGFAAYTAAYSLLNLIEEE